MTAFQGSTSPRPPRQVSWVVRHTQGRPVFSKKMKLEEPPRLYTDLATWWPLFSPPSDYTEEAADLMPALLSATDAPPRTLLELGCGGGSLAYHLKDRLQLTLTDRSRGCSRSAARSTPSATTCSGTCGRWSSGESSISSSSTMRSCTPPTRPRYAPRLRTAHRHCRPGGAALFLPDFVKETFAAKTSTGGEDGPDGRGLRYLEWTWDPDSTDDTCEVAYAFLLREPSGTVRVESDRHRVGLFPRAAWLHWMRETGFSVRSRTDPWGRDVFLGTRPSREYGGFRS